MVLGMRSASKKGLLLHLYEVPNMLWSQVCVFAKIMVPDPIRWSRFRIELWYHRAQKQSHGRS